MPGAARLRLLLVPVLAIVAASAGCKVSSAAAKRVREDDVFIYSHGFGWGSDGRATAFIQLGKGAFEPILPYAEQEARADGDEVRYRVILLAALATEVRRNAPVDPTVRVEASDIREVDAPDRVLAVLDACLVSQHRDLRGLARLVAGETADARCFAMAIDHLADVLLEAREHHHDDDHADPDEAEEPQEVRLAVALLQDIALPNGAALRAGAIATGADDEGAAPARRPDDASSGFAVPWPELLRGGALASPNDPERGARLLNELRAWLGRAEGALPKQARW